MRWRRRRCRSWPRCEMKRQPGAALRLGRAPGAVPRPCRRVSPAPLSQQPRRSWLGTLRWLVGRCWLTCGWRRENRGRRCDSLSGRRNGSRERRRPVLKKDALQVFPAVQREPREALEPAGAAIDVRKKLPLNPKQNDVDREGDQGDNQNDQVDVF